MKNFETIKGKYLAVGFQEQYKEIKGRRFLSELANGLAKKVKDKDIEVVGSYKATNNKELSDKIGQPADELGLNVGDMVFRI